MSGDLLTDPDVKRLTKPASRWRNRWRLLRACPAIARGSEITVVLPTHVSKDMAHTEADADLIAMFARQGVTMTLADIPDWFAYLGAFPVETP